jgi:hypothetical protein
MCGQCRTINTGVDWFSSGTDGSLAGSRRSRAEVARVASAMLAGEGLSVVVYPSSMTFSVQTRTGKSIIVSRLDEIGDAARRLIGHHVDPLAPDVVAAARARRGQAGRP